MSKYRLLIEVSVLAAIVMLASMRATRAQDNKVSALVPVIRTISPERLLTIMKEEGYSVTTDSDGDIVWRIEGYKTYVRVMSDSDSILFLAAFKKTANSTIDKVNEWNRAVRFSRSYLDDVGDPRLESDLVLRGGVTEERIKDYLQTCRSSFVLWQARVL